MQKALLVVATSLAMLSPATITPPATAAHTNHFGETSRRVANEIDCKRFDANGGGGAFYRTGVCWLRGKRVNVITFRNRQQQRNWNEDARFYFDSNFYWANGIGALVTARNGNRPAAKLGARRLPGDVRHG